ncbi:unnamed protein product [Durusdinium trenchii]|uniref:USP domain-containing protein n=1 Tax=Durusdinium trenchii TaxID=1381693 RepID=A0ABP0MXT9_9DINO
MQPTRYLGHFQCLDILSTTELPFFYDDGVDLQWSAFRIQSIVCHTGSSISGHFRAVLRCTEGWYICQDNEPPTFHAHLPKWCLERAVLIWMIPITDEVISDHQTQDSSSESDSESGPPDPQDHPVSPEGAPALSLVLQSVLESVLDDTDERWLR